MRGTIRGQEQYRREGNLLMGMGLLLMLAAFCMIGYNLADGRRAARVSAEALAEVKRQIPHLVIPAEPEGAAANGIAGGDPGEQVIPDYKLDPHIGMPTVEADGQEYVGYLELPELSLSLPIISEWSYPRLKLAPCRYQGSVYQDNLIIAGHNYDRHFGRLLTLGIGSEAHFTDAAGNTFTYELISFEELSGTDVSAMESGDWDMTLFTCTVGGRTRIAARYEIVD